MVSLKPFELALWALFLAQPAICQDRLVEEIPPEEKIALAAIVEDEPPAPVALKKSGSLSPKYNFIYQKPLPIPPVKQPLK
jgi:hypothetical protein